MPSRKSGWNRLAAALTLLWSLAVLAIAVYDWLVPPGTGRFVRTVLEEPRGADLFPLTYHFQFHVFLAALLAPLAIWLLYFLSSWVIAGFKPSEP